MRSIKIPAIIIFIFLFHTTCFAKGDIAALGNLKGVYATLKIYEKMPHGMAYPRINRSALLKYFNGELTKYFESAQGFKVYNVPGIVPPLNVTVIIEGEGQKKGYNVKTTASLKQGSSEWYEQVTIPWIRKEVLGKINAAEASVIEAERDLKDEQLYFNEIEYSEWIRNRSKDRIAKDKATLDKAKEKLAKTKKDYSLLSITKLSLKFIGTSLLVGYAEVLLHEKEFEKVERETAELLNQLEDKPVSSGTEKPYVEPSSQSRKNIFYETGSSIKLFNPADTTIAIYKDESLSNITNIFANGIKATVTGFKKFPDKSIAYKVQILLKDGSSYVGWAHENVIRP